MHNTHPLVSIIIINFNGKRYLKKCFDSLLNGTYKNIELIFVDNGSTDGSLGFIKENYPQAIIIDNMDNLGLAVASNKGASRAKGNCLFFYNNDTIAEEHLIEKLVNEMESDPSIGICGCKTYTYDGKHVINAGVSCDIFGYPYGRRQPFYVDAAIFIRKEVFVQIDGFDEMMFLYGEDRDICWRCWLYGYKVKAVKDAIFYHDSACATQDMSKYRANINRRFLSEFNALRSILKNYSLVTLSFVLPLFAIINLAEILVFLSLGKTSIVNKVYLKSYLENIKCFKDIVNGRKKIQKERKVSDLDILKLMDKISGKFRLIFDMGIPAFDEQA